MLMNVDWEQTFVSRTAITQWEATAVLVTLATPSIGTDADVTVSASR